MHCSRLDPASWEQEGTLTISNRRLHKAKTASNSQIECQVPNAAQKEAGGCLPGRGSCGSSHGHSPEQLLGVHLKNVILKASLQFCRGDLGDTHRCAHRSFPGVHGPRRTHMGPHPGPSGDVSRGYPCGSSARVSQKLGRIC